MAEFLIALQPHGDPADKTTQQVGDCVSYKPDGFEWGTLEHKPTFDAWQKKLDPEDPEDAEHIGKWHGLTGILKVPDMPLHRAGRVVGTHRRVYKTWMTAVGNDDPDTKTATRTIERLKGDPASLKGTEVKLINKETGALVNTLPVIDQRVLLGEGNRLFSDDFDIVDGSDEALIDWEIEEEVIAQRAWSVDLASMTQAQRDALTTQGELTVTTQDAAAFLVSKITGEGVDKA